MWECNACTKDGWPYTSNAIQGNIILAMDPRILAMQSNITLYLQCNATQQLFPNPLLLTT